jgi:hypothetical protein
MIGSSSYYTTVRSLIGKSISEFAKHRIGGKYKTEILCSSIIFNILCRLHCRKKWHGCLTGQLTEEELGVSALLSQIWTNFAINGEPGHGALPWSRDRPYYLR